MGAIREDVIHIVCDCYSPEHTLRYMWDPDHRRLYTEVYLRPKVWYKRLWVGLKYIFGYTSMHGHWDCTLMDEDSMGQLYLFMQHKLMETNRKG